MDAIDARASVRSFTDEPVDEKDLRSLLSAAMAAPSAGNQQPWEFYVVTDEGLRKQLAAASHYAGPAKAAPTCVVFCFREDVRFPTMVQQDMGACAQNFLLRATSLGLGAVWLGIYPEQNRVDAVAKALDMPRGVTPFALVAVGHPAKPPVPKGTLRYDESRIHWC